LEVASRHPVFTEMDDIAGGIYVPHIELTRDVDSIIVYPATVNILSKVANGITDELIAALILATRKPVFFLPVTNEAKSEHAPLQGELMLFDPVNAKFFVLNETMSYVWRACDGSVSLQEIAGRLVEEYSGVETETAQRDVDSAAAELTSLGLLVD